jgi:hypothetical protein
MLRENHGRGKQSVTRQRGPKLNSGISHPRFGWLWAAGCWGADGIFSGIMAAVAFGQPLGPFWGTLFANASTVDLWGSVLKWS